MSMEIHENRNLYKTDYANQLKAKPKEDKETEKTQNESKASDQSTAIQDEYPQAVNICLLPRSARATA